MNYLNKFFRLLELKEKITLDQNTTKEITEYSKLKEEIIESLNREDEITKILEHFKKISPPELEQNFNEILKGLRNIES